MAARNDEKRSAEQYRLLQATALLKLYRQAHDGVPASTRDAVQAWVMAGGLRDENLRDGAVDPFTVLTDEEIDEIVKGGQ